MRDAPCGGARCQQHLRAGQRVFPAVPLRWHRKARVVPDGTGGGDWYLLGAGSGGSGCVMTSVTTGAAGPPVAAAAVAAIPAAATAACATAHVAPLLSARRPARPPGCHHRAGRVGGPPLCAWRVRPRSAVAATTATSRLLAVTSTPPPHARRCAKTGVWGGLAPPVPAQPLPSVSAAMRCHKLCDCGEGGGIEPPALATHLFGCDGSSRGYGGAPRGGVLPSPPDGPRLATVDGQAERPFPPPP